MPKLSLLGGGRDEDVAGRVPARQVRARHVAEEVDVAARTAGGTVASKRGAQVGVADDQQARAAAGALDHLGHRGEQVLDALARIEPADEQDVDAVRIAAIARTARRRDGSARCRRRSGCTRYSPG